MNMEWSNYRMEVICMLCLAPDNNQAEVLYTDWSLYDNFGGRPMESELQYSLKGMVP